MQMPCHALVQKNIGSTLWCVVQLNCAFPYKMTFEKQLFFLPNNFKTVWPSGLRRQTQVLVERSAWVRTPQLSLWSRPLEKHPLWSRSLQSPDLLGLFADGAGVSNPCMHNDVRNFIHMSMSDMNDVNEICWRSCLDARVVKGVDLRSTGLQAAWVRTPLQALLCHRIDHR